jgi:hypothetical protein
MFQHFSVAASADMDITSGIQGVKLGEIAAGTGPDLGRVGPPRSRPHLPEMHALSHRTQIWAKLPQYADTSLLSGCGFVVRSG